MDNQRDSYPSLEGVTVEVKVVAILPESLQVEASFHNSRSSSLRVDKGAIFAWGDMEGPSFAVRRSGKKVAYIGELVSRRAPLPEDYYHMAPGETYTKQIDLAQYYDLSRGGSYTVAYDDLWWVPTADGQENLYRVRSNTAAFHLSEGIEAGN